MVTYYYCKECNDIIGFSEPDTLTNQGDWEEYTNDPDFKLCDKCLKESKQNEINN